MSAASSGAGEQANLNRTRSTGGPSIKLAVTKHCVNEMQMFQLGSFQRISTPKVTTDLLNVSVLGLWLS